MKMNPEVKALWCDALESGEFEQVRGKLRSPVVCGYGYCCLGVLSEVYRRHTGNGEWDGRAFLADPDHCADRDDGIGTPPREVAEWAFDLETRNPNVIIDGLDLSVAEHNDSRLTPRTFKEIAKAVREQL